MSILAVERRQVPDRRTTPTPAVSRFTGRGRRRKFRRAMDREGGYVDVYGEVWLFGIAVSTLILSILDGYLTLIHLQNGGRELNPLVDILIGMGWTPFMAVKSGLSAVCVAFLVVHKNFLFVKKLMIGVFIIYLLLLFYHLYLRTLH